MMSDEDDPLRVSVMAPGAEAVYNLETLAGVGLSSALVSTDEDGRVRGNLGELGRSPAAFGWAAAVLEESGASGAGEAQRAADAREQGAGLRRAAELLTRTMDVVQRALDAAGMLEDVQYQRQSGLGAMARTLAKGANPAAGAEVVRRRRFRRELVLDDAGELQVNAEGVLVLDELLATILDKLESADAAAKVRATPAEERGARWVGPVPKACRALLKGVWAARKDEIEKLEASRAEELERAKHNRPALVRTVVADRLLPAMTRQLQLIDDGVVRNDTGRQVGTIVIDGPKTLEALQVVRTGLPLLGSVPGHKLIRTLVHRGFEQHELGAADARKVVFKGGWQALAEAVGFGEHENDKLQAIARAGQAVVWKGPRVTVGGLWTFQAIRGNQHRPGEVSFVLGDALMPGLAKALASEGGKSLSAREARRLVPELRFEPPTGGVRFNDEGAVWTLHRLFLLELVDRAEELAQAGDVAIPEKRWRALFEQARLPWTTYERVLGAWREGESATAPALVVERNKWRFTLGDSHELERAFIAERGERSLVNRVNGKAGVAKKTADAVRRRAEKARVSKGSSTSASKKHGV